MSNLIYGIAKDLKSIPESLKAKAGNVDKKKLVLMNLPYALAGYFCDKVACLWRVSPGQDASAKMMEVMAGLEGLFSNPLPSFYLLAPMIKCKKTPKKKCRFMAERKKKR